jgi:photosystem I subunit 10
VIYSTLLAAAGSVPNTVEWSPKVAIVMILCNIIAIAIGKYGIKIKDAGGALPSPGMFGGMGFGALMGTTAFGHILGVGTILALANAGVL